jgi:hypothetical protein
MGHEYQDRVSLEIHRRVAAGLTTRPEWMAMARENLGRWMERNAESAGLMRCYREWLDILDSKSVAEVCAILTAETDEGQRLRQNAPFVGALSDDKVWDIRREFWHLAPWGKSVPFHRTPYVIIE